MIGRVFVDCNVILDLLLERKPFFDAAAELFTIIEQDGLDACVSPLVFSNLFYILRKDLSGPGARAALRKLRTLMQVLPANEKSLDRALASSSTDFEDAVHYYFALEHGLDAIVTRDPSGFEGSQLPILTAEGCVELWRRQT
ncbi:MAG: PIN domain-containing protein [Thermoanaerobaculia bacterium]|nr:PIN domain-containing protein [Thermoanaerobaculia bacterium]